MRLIMFILCLLWVEISWAGTPIPYVTNAQFGNYTNTRTPKSVGLGSVTNDAQVKLSTLQALGTGILKNTTTTGALSIAVAGDFPTLNQDTSGNAATVTTNANLTGPITSTGNATAIANQTGTGSKFVMDTSPVLITPTLGAATVTSINGFGTSQSGAASSIPVTDASGNIGIGVAPSPWNASFRSVEVATKGSALMCGTAGQNTILTNNLYYDGAFKYGVGASQGSYFQQSVGVFYWNIASGNLGAGNAPTTVTSVMTLDSTNGLQPNKLTVNSGANTVYRCTGTTNLGMLTVNSAACVTGFATTSLKLD